MASLGGSTVSSSYNRLLILPSGGGDGANLVQLKDGDEGTSFALKISNDAISIDTNQKLYFDNGGDTYITESSNGIMDFYTAGKLALRLNPTGTGSNHSALYADQLYIGHGDMGVDTDSRMNLQSQHASVSGTGKVHSIQITGDAWTDDILLLGREVFSTNLGGIVLNGQVGIGTHGTHPTGPRADFHLVGEGGTTCELVADMGAPTYGTGLLTSSTEGAGWSRGYHFMKHDVDWSGGSGDQYLGGFQGYGSGQTLTRLTIGQKYDTPSPGIHLNMTTGYVGIGENDGQDAYLCINQRDNDGNILTFKSTDVNHLYTARAETDTFAEFRKRSATAGGLDIEVFGESTVSQGMGMRVCAGDMSTTQATGYAGMIDFFVEKIDASGVLQDSITTNGNVFTIGGRISGAARRIFTVDASGDLHCDGAGTLTVYDTYDDAHLVRAIDSSGDNVKGLIKSKWDDYVQYNEDTLIDAGILGDKIEKGGMTNITRLQRLHNGAIWQQYEQFQNLLQAFTKVSNKVIGKEATKELLDSNNIKKLGDA